MIVTLCMEASLSSSGIGDGDHSFFAHKLFYGRIDNNLPYTQEECTLHTAAVGYDLQANDCLPSVVFVQLYQLLFEYSSRLTDSARRDIL